MTKYFKPNQQYGTEGMYYYAEHLLAQLQNVKCDIEFIL